MPAVGVKNVNNMNNLLSYKDVILKVTECSNIASRKLCITDVTLGGILFKMPLVPANMSCCIDLATYKTLAQNGYFAILHRFSPYRYISDTDFVLSAVESLQSERFVSISVGTGQPWRHVLDTISKRGLRLDFLTIDIAHGWSINMKETVQYARKLFKYVCIIGGNISCGKAAHELVLWGCDVVKVGLSMGAACSTYETTGVGTPMFSAVLETRGHIANIPIIADGQVRCGGDMAKALVAGASMVMAGSIFAACADSPAPIVNGKKMYFGSASSIQKGHDAYVEGKILYLEPNQDTYLQFLEKWQHKLQSSMSYINRQTISGLYGAQWEALKTRE